MSWRERGAGGATFAALDLGTNTCRLLVARPAWAGFRVVDAFSRIDDTLHGGTGSTYADEANAISKELGAFRAFLAEHRP